MGRNRDKFWEHAKDLLNGRFKCNYCGHEFSGGGTRIKYHLSGVTRGDIDICLEVPPEVKSRALQAISASENKHGKSRSLNNDGETEVISTSAPNKKAKSLRQPTTILGECKKDKSVVDKMLANFIISNNIPPDFAKIPYLVDLLRSVAEFGPSYEIPNTSALTSQLIPGIKVEEHIGNVKKLFTTTGCTLLMYEVEENSKIVGINVFAYTPAGLLYTNKIAVPERGMTSSNFTSSLVASICSIIKSLGPENVVQCIVDYRRVIKEDRLSSVVSMIRKKYPWIHVHANACWLVFYLLAMYLSVPWIHKTTKLAVIIFRYLREHDFNLLPKRDHTSNIKKYHTSWMASFAIEFYVLRTILEVERELQALQLLPIASEGPSREENVAEIVDEAIHSMEFWSRGKKVEQVLQSLFLCLELTYGNGSTFGYLYEAMKGVEEAIKQHCDGDDKIHGERIIKCFRFWSDHFVKPVHAAAAFLNPAYFCSETFAEDTKMQEGLRCEMLLRPPEEREALSKQLQLYRMKVPELFSAAAMNMRNTIHPRKWWECFGDHCPILQKLAIQILSQPCAAPKHSLINFQPNDPVDELRMNIIMMEEFGMIKSQNLEPTYLDRMSHKLPVYADEDVKEFVEHHHQIYKAQHGLLLINNPSDQVAKEFILRKRPDTLMELNNLMDKVYNQPLDDLPDFNLQDLPDISLDELCDLVNYDFGDFNQLGYDQLLD